MRYTTTDGPNKPLNAIQEGSLGDKMGIAETYRLPLVLSEIEGLTQKEVATRLGLSLSGAKSRVQRGREKLRQRLYECCDIETGRHGIIGYEVRDKKHGCNCG